jgi:hypothetical protein
MVTLGGQEDLSLMGEPAEGLAVQDSVSVSLKSGAQRVRLFRNLSTS